jgi:methionyl-tRNA formyltransferase
MSAVKQFARNHGLALEQPATLKDPAAVQQLTERSADVMVVVAYGLLLPQSVLDAPRFGCLNVHASLLPRWRGAAPIQRAILAGDEITGVTIMQMDAGLDTGPMLLKRTTPILAQDTSATLHDRLAALGSQALLEALSSIDTAVAEPQPPQGATYATKIRKEEAAIDWTQSAVHIHRQVRAFNPWPIAQTTWAGRQLRIWEASPSDERHNANPGTVLRCAAEGIDVATGKGLLTLNRVQLAGRNPMSAAQFVNAHRLQDAVLVS